MVLGGPLRQEQGRGDLAVGLARRDQPGDLQLSRCQRCRRRRLAGRPLGKGPGPLQPRLHPEFGRGGCGTLGKLAGPLGIAGAAIGLVAACLGAAGAAIGGGAAGAAIGIASAPHWALRKSFHFWPLSVPDVLAA